MPTLRLLNSITNRVKTGCAKKDSFVMFRDHENTNKSQKKNRKQKYSKKTLQFKQWQRKKFNFRKTKKNTFQNKDVADYVNKHYYAVKFNGEGNDVIKFNGKEFKNAGYNPALANRRNSPHDLTRYFKVNAYPTMVFIDEQGGFIFPLRGYKTPQQLELYLKMFKNDDHKDMKTQEAFNEYYKAFKPEFVQK